MSADENRLPVSHVPFEQGVELSVVEWHNKPEPTGHPDCVALLIDSPVFARAAEIVAAVEEAPELRSAQLVVRLKSAAAVDDVIRALRKHRNNVWPHEREG